jgi:hypothetical protein
VDCRDESEGIGDIKNGGGSAAGDGDLIGVGEASFCVSEVFPGCRFGYAVPVVDGGLCFRMLLGGLTGIGIAVAGVTLGSSGTSDWGESTGESQAVRLSSPTCLAKAQRRRKRLGRVFKPQI